MYGDGGLGGGGVASIAAGAIILPDTRGHIVLTIVAFTSITVGTVILLSIIGRKIAKTVYSKG